jgi:hypothetical protein
MSRLSERKCLPPGQDEASRLLDEIYTRIERLSLHQKAAVAQHILRSNALSVVVTRRTDAKQPIQQMSYAELGDTLEAIASRLRKLPS